MRKSKHLLMALGLVGISAILPSCLDDSDDVSYVRPTALVTVIPASDLSFVLQLDNTTTLYPSNMTVSPFGNKEVRALVNYETDGEPGSNMVHINWMDSIRTKLPVASCGIDDALLYGDDAVDIVNDWVTVAEDGYLTLRVRTVWGNQGRIHYFNLLTGVNPDNPYELELRHNAGGDLGGAVGDALIAFNLNGLPRTDGDDVKITLRWNSFAGPKTADIDLSLRPDGGNVDADGVKYNRSVK